MIYDSRFKSKLLTFSLILLLTSYLLFPSTAQAVCPVCTIAVGAGLGLSRYLGIDDTISGIWVGGFILSSSFWLIDWMYKKYPSKLKRFNSLTVSSLIVLSMYALVLIPLWYGKIIGDPFNTILSIVGGVDKLLFGIFLGSLTFLFGMWADKKIREKKGKQLFNYQKVVFPVVSLVIASLVIYYWGGYLY